MITCVNPECRNQGLLIEATPQKCGVCGQEMLEVNDG